METAGLRFMQWRRAGIAADEEGGDGLRQRAAQFSNCLDPGLAIRQAKIRNDQIRRSLLIGETRKGAAARSTDDTTTLQPQLRSSPQVLSSTSGSSSMTTISLPF